MENVEQNASPFFQLPKNFNLVKDVQMENVEQNASDNTAD